MKKICLIVAFCLIVMAASCIRIEKPENGSGSGETENSENTTESIVSDESKADYTGLVFATDDRDGNTWDQSVFGENKLTMLNFWEPWCGPCVGEMPDLEKLSADYMEQGFAILGIYSTADMEDDVDMVLQYTGVTYPILHYTDVFDQFQTGYVPTTVFVDAQGQVLGEPYVGSRSYKEWAGIIEELLSGEGQ